MEDSPISKVIVSDTIDLDQSKIFSKLEVLSVSDVFGMAIKHITDGSSLSSMFNL